jgi:hypothetical protein
MLRITMNPMMIRSMFWLVAAVLAVSVFLFWSGGFDQLLEYANDLF